MLYSEWLAIFSVPHSVRTFLSHVVKTSRASACRSPALLRKHVTWSCVSFARALVKRRCQMKLRIHARSFDSAGTPQELHQPWQCGTKSRRWVKRVLRKQPSNCMFNTALRMLTSVQHAQRWRCNRVANFVTLWHHRNVVSLTAPPPRSRTIPSLPNLRADPCLKGSSHSGKTRWHSKYHYLRGLGPVQWSSTVLHVFNLEVVPILFNVVSP